MSDNARKTPLAPALRNVASVRAADKVQILGKDLPCKVMKVTGQLVTVSFLVDGVFTLPQVEMAIDTRLEDWYPVQVGTLGVARPSDVYIGGVTGLGGGNADYTQRGNLATLVFHPVSNKAWKPPSGTSQDDRIVRNNSKGSAGVYLVSLDSNGHVKTKLYVDNNGTCTITGDLHVTGAVIAGYGGSDQVGLQTHRHPQGNDSHGDAEQDTDAPVPGS